MLLLKTLSIIILTISHLFIQTKAVTHWVVTENGRIQSQVASPFAIRRPYDLLTLMEQEQRRDNINTIYHDLLARKESIEKKWTSLERITSKGIQKPGPYPECVFNGQEFPDIDELDLYYHIAINGSEREGIAFTCNSSKDEVKVYKVPDCTKYSKLDFSMSAYEHFSSMRERSTMNITAEDSLKKLMPVPSVKLFGHEIVLGLNKNKSSWMHYNMGALYWRIKGNGTKSIECSRRALHYVPSEFRDIPLHNLAGTLHASRRYSKEAAILLSAAIELTPEEPSHYLALGHVYFSLRDFNRSSQAFNKYLKFRPDQKDLYLLKFVMCHWKIEKGLISLQDSLEGVLSELHEYHSQQQQLIRLQERLIWEQSAFNIDLPDLSLEQMNPFLTKKSQRCVQKTTGGSKPTISCDFTDGQFPDFDMLNLKNLFQHVESETQKINEQLASGSHVVIKTKPKPPQKDQAYFDSLVDAAQLDEGPALSQKYPPSMSMSSNQYFDSTSWPTKDECTAWALPVHEKDNLDLPVFLPPENKGYKIKQILSKMIGIKNGSEHPLPWYPPVCENFYGEKYVPATGRQSLNKELKANAFLQDHLLKYVNGGKSQEAEIGQRIITAMEKKAAPSWVLATLASLYWRVRGNTRKALNCLDLAFQKLRKEPSDAVLVSIGSVIHELGYDDHALKFATVALKINHAEPATNFLLALLHYSAHNPLVAMYYMKNVLRVEPKYYRGMAEKLLKTWACRIKLGAYEGMPKEKKKEEMCLSGDGFESEGVVCSANGDQCKTANIHCYRASNIHIDDEKLLEKSIQKTVTVQHCGRRRKVSSVEGSGDLEPDQSRLESFSESEGNGEHNSVFMFSEDGGPTELTMLPSDMEDFSPTAVVHVYDKSGNYPLSLQSCRDLRDADWMHFSSMWQSIATRNIDISPFLKPLTKSVMDVVKPHCSRDIPSSKFTLDHLTTSLLRSHFTSKPDNSLSELLGLMAGDQHASVKELGAKIGSALHENSTSWILATSAALYWRVVGSTEEAIICLRQALAYVPNDMRDIPLVNLANVLQRVGLLKEALEATYTALKAHPDFVVNHFTAGNIHTAMGDLDKAINFYRSSLLLEPNFEPARNRLQMILCTLLFDEEFHKNHLKSNKFSSL